MSRSKREQNVVQSQTQPRQGRDTQVPVLSPGIIIVRLCCQYGRRRALRLRFHVTGDPVDLVAKVVRVAQTKKRKDT